MDQLNRDMDMRFARTNATRFVYDRAPMEAERLRHVPPYDIVILNHYVQFEVMDITTYSYRNLKWAYVENSSHMIDNYGRRWALPLGGGQPQRRVDEKEPGSYFYEQYGQEGAWVDQDGDIQTGWNREKRISHCHAQHVRQLPAQNDGRDAIFCNLDRIRHLRRAHEEGNAVLAAQDPPRRAPRLLQYRNRPAPVAPVRPDRMDGARPPRDNPQ